MNTYVVETCTIFGAGNKALFLLSKRYQRLCIGSLTDHSSCSWRTIEGESGVFSVHACIRRQVKCGYPGQISCKKFDMSDGSLDNCLALHIPNYSCQCYPNSSQIPHLCCSVLCHR